MKAFRFHMLLIAMMLALPMSQAQDVKPVSAEVPASLKPFSGVWKPDSIIHEGTQHADATARERIRLSIENNTYKMFYVTDAAKGLGQRLATSSLSVDSSSKQFELVFADGPRKGETLHGIYELTAQTLKLCYGPAGKNPRPKQFDAPKGSGFFCETWTREK